MATIEERINSLPRPLAGGIGAGLVFAAYRSGVAEVLWYHLCDLFGMAPVSAPIAGAPAAGIDTLLDVLGAGVAFGTSAAGEKALRPNGTRGFLDRMMSYPLGGALLMALPELTRFCSLAGYNSGYRWGAMGNDLLKDSFALVAAYLIGRGINTLSHLRLTPTTSQPKP